MRARVTIALVSVAASMLVAASSAQARTYYPDCRADQQYKPASLIFFCADAGVTAKRMSWYRWGAREARGRSRYVYANSCTPSCAEGTRHRYRGRVVLYRARRCPTNGRTVFTRLALIFEGKAPPGLAKIRQRLFCRPL